MHRTEHIRYPVLCSEATLPPDEIHHCESVSKNPNWSLGGCRAFRIEPSAEGRSFVLRGLPTSSQPPSSPTPSPADTSPPVCTLSHHGITARLFPQHPLVTSRSWLSPAAASDRGRSISSCASLASAKLQEASITWRSRLRGKWNKG